MTIDIKLCLCKRFNSSSSPYFRKTDPNPPYQRKCAFDVGDYGLGYCANSLELGCDCLGR